jgi:hypothetical protein
MIRVRDELEERPVGIAEVHAHARSLRSAAGHRSGLHPNAVGFKVRGRQFDRTVPLEAEVAIAGDDGDARDHRRPHSRTVHVQLQLANSVGDSSVDLDDLRTEDVAIKGGRAFEVGDRDHDVVQAHARTIRNQAA